MPLWDHSIREITSRLDCRQWAFLAAPSRDLHLMILLILYRARRQEAVHELSFNLLHESLAAVAEELTCPDHAGLRASLNQLEEWGNVAMRLEPKQVRTIADRGLKLMLVRLTESTNSILEHLDSHFEAIQQDTASSAGFSLLEVEDALTAVSSLLRSVDRHSDEDYCRAARELSRARKAVEEAGEELLRLDLWLSETAVKPPDRQRLLDLLAHLQTYFERYLQQVDARRERCFEKLETLLTDEASAFLLAITEALEREFADDPMRSGRRVPEVRPILHIIQEFLKSDGILDYRRTLVHQRLADVVGHLRRYLAEMVRRSQLGCIFAQDFSRPLASSRCVLCSKCRRLLFEIVAAGSCGDR